jgi:hypothetical protein
MQEVKIAIPKSNADLWEESNMRAAAFANY